MAPPSKKPSKRPAERRNRKSVEERRAELLSLGLEMFKGSAYGDISIDAIAEAAGISKGLLYHYFPSKRAYYVAAIRHAADELLAYTTAAAPESASPLEQLRPRLHAYLEYVERHAVNYIFLLRGGLSDDEDVQAILEEVREAFRQQFREVLGSVADEPRFRIVVRGLVGFVEFASLEWLERKKVTAAELVDTLARILEAAVLVTIGHGEDAAESRPSLRH